MYICKIHGKLKNEWCNECSEIIPCNHLDVESTRFKDLTYDSNSGERTITIILKSCKTCGKPLWVYYKELS